MVTTRGQGDKGTRGKTVHNSTIVECSTAIKKSGIKSKLSDYKYEAVGKNLRISTTDGDLVAVVEDTLNLQPSFVPDTFEIFTLQGNTPELGFDEELYLNVYPEIAKLVNEGKFSGAIAYHAQVGQYEELEDDGAV